MAQVSTRVVAALAALSLAVPALASCSDDPPSGSPPPTSSSSSSPTGSATPSGPPALPDAAKGRTPEAAEAFVRYYVDLINYGLETLDSKPLGVVSSMKCEECQRLVGAFDATRRKGGNYKGGAWTIGSVDDLGNGSESFAQVQAALTIGRVAIVSASGEKPARFPRQRVVYTFTLSRGDSWKVEQIREAQL